MSDVGIFNLGDATITAAVTDDVITSASDQNEDVQAYVANLDGATGVTLFVDFDYRGGGTTAIVIVQTSLNQGSDWIDIARFDFATASRQAVCNLTSVAKGVTTVVALAAEGVLDGILGDRLRAKRTTTGTYTLNTAVSVRASVRQ